MKRYCGSLLAFCLLLSLIGRAQEKDTLPIHKDTLFIHFDFGRSRMRSDAIVAIDSLLARHELAYPLERIDLSGHCDSVGGNVYNDRLSLERIGAVRRYLQSKRIPDSLFRGMKGYGKRHPLNDNADEEERSLNRRVEIIFYSPGIPAVVKSPIGPGSKPVAVSTDIAGNPTPPLTLAEFFRDSAGAGKSFVLRNLNFEVGRHVLLPYSDTILKELLKIMLDSPRLKVEIRGHVCCIPPTLDGLDADTRTEDLSVRRARFVYDYLRQRGVKASRMSYHGFGASQKLYPEERNEQEEEMNRRVEIKRKNPQD